MHGRRYRPLEELSLADGRAAPRPWPDFWRGGAGRPWSAAYSVPESLALLLPRLEENLVYYLVRQSSVSSLSSKQSNNLARMPPPVQYAGHKTTRLINLSQAGQETKFCLFIHLSQAERPIYSTCSQAGHTIKGATRHAGWSRNDRIGYFDLCFDLHSSFQETSEAS